MLELFAGSGTTLFAYENLRKDYIGFAPPKKIIDYVNSIMSEWSSINYAIKSVDVTDRQPFSRGDRSISWAKGTERRSIL